jgi:TonB family protein
MRNRIVLVIISVVFTYSGFTQNKIWFVTGEILEAKSVKVKAEQIEYVAYNDSENNLIHVDISDVFQIEFEDNLKRVFNYSSMFNKIHFENKKYNIENYVLSKKQCKSLLYASNEKDVINHVKLSKRYLGRTLILGTIIVTTGILTAILIEDEDEAFSWTFMTIYTAAPPGIIYYFIHKKIFNDAVIKYNTNNEHKILSKFNIDEINDINQQDKIKSKKYKNLLNITSYTPTIGNCINESDDIAKTQCTYQKIQDYINQNIQYTSKAKEENISGTVYTRFVVEADGKIDDIHIVKGFNKEYDTEAIRLLKNMPKWNANINSKNNIPVYVAYYLPIKFDPSKTNENNSNNSFVIESTPTPINYLTYAVKEQMPYLEGCASSKNEFERLVCSEGKAQEFFKQNMQYPKNSKDNNIEGTVYINFEISDDGKVSNINVFGSLNEECDAEAVRLVKNMPKWNPAMKNNKPTKVRYNLPIHFNLK